MKYYDPLHGAIDVPPPFDQIVNSKWFRRLQHLRQLGLCYLSFPGGNHSRFEHSLGAYHLATVAGQSLNYGTSLNAKRDRERLTHILRLALLCHDIGHGPFSHMTENVIMGLGKHVSHEEIGAAIVSHMLEKEFLEFSEKWDITPELIAAVITKSPLKDEQAKAAISLTSGDLDLDRLDYLHRDSHYAGIKSSAVPSKLEGLWGLQRIGEQLYVELTEEGVEFANSTLFLRRNNYQRIVFESRHMAATAMFEKAVASAIENGELGKRYSDLSSSEMDWRDADSVAKEFDKLWPLLGLVDYSLLSLLKESSDNSKYLTRKIQRGDFFDSISRLKWDNIHYLSKQVLDGLKSEKAAFNLRRKIEKYIAENVNTAPLHVAVHVPRLPSAKLFTGGVSGGKSFGEKSALGLFLQEDAINQYAIEVFVDPNVGVQSRESARELTVSLFTDGLLGGIL